MLASLVDAPFDDPDWLFEIKWDGYRAVAELDDGIVRLYSRNDLTFNERYPVIVTALAKLNRQAVLDGEVVVLDEAGVSRFQLLQNYPRTGQGILCYSAFDLLYLDGVDVRDRPLTERKKLLKKLLPKKGPLRFSDHVAADGTAFFAAALKQGLEGVMAKRADSPYRTGLRSRDWLKMKTHQRQEAVIGGFTAPQGSRRHLGALLLGVYERGKLVYIGHAGGGFSEASLGEVHAKLKALVRGSSPFAAPPKPNAPVTWVTPKLVCEVSFAEWTETGTMRQPIFLGLREDKPASAVRRERRKPVQRIVRR